MAPSQLAGKKPTLALHLLRAASQSDTDLQVQKVAIEALSDLLLLT